MEVVPYFNLSDISNLFKASFKITWPHNDFISGLDVPLLVLENGQANKKLVCGHVISKDALNKLERSGRLKCSYCPKEQLPSETLEII